MAAAMLTLASTAAAEVKTREVEYRQGDPLTADAYGYGLCSQEACSVRRLYGDVVTPIGLLRVGRQRTTVCAVSTCPVRTFGPATSITTRHGLPSSRRARSRWRSIRSHACSSSCAALIRMQSMPDQRRSRTSA